MQIHFSGHHIEVTPALRSFTQEKLGKLERHFDRINAIHVIFDVEKLVHIAEATIQINKAEIHGKAESDDMYTAIDELVDKLDRQLMKHKGKILDHRDHRDHKTQDRQEEE